MNYIIYQNQDNYGIREIPEKLYKQLLYSEIHLKNQFTVSVEKIQQYFNITINHSEDVNIILINELNETQIEEYLGLYNFEEGKLDKFIEFLMILTYNQINLKKSNVSITKKLTKCLDGLSSYWENPNQYTLNYKFNSRKFNNRENKINFKKELEENEETEEKIKDFINIEGDYLDDIIRENKWDKKYSSSSSSSSSYYVLSEKSNMTNEEIIQIYNLIPTKYLQYMFVCHMLCSRSHCHLIINNKLLLEMINPLFNEFKPLFKYILGYTWLTLTIEEQNKKVKDTDRIIFDIDTANLLPIYPFTCEDINQNPYASVLIDNDLINLKKNCLSLDMIEDYEKYYGVCSSVEFSRRLNIFVNGQCTKGVLDFIDWSCCAVSGSAVTACGMKYNPLIHLHKENINNEITDEDLLSYFFHYYNDSDIDLLCNKISIFDFIETISVLNDKLMLYDELVVENIKTSSIMVTDELIINIIDDINNYLNQEKKEENIEYDLEYVKTNLNKLDIKKYFYEKYYIDWQSENQIKVEELNKQDNLFYTEYIRLIPLVEFRVYNISYELNDNKNKDYEKYLYDDTNKIVGKLTQSIRYKIMSKNNKFKTFEIFKTQNENFFSTIAKFHLGMVRAYWNGETLKCLPSYISSMMINMATYYNYFASIRDPIEIVNKYRSRGFGIILNNYEKKHMINFIKKNNKICWNIYNLNETELNYTELSKNIFGAKNINDNIFKLSKYTLGLTEDCYKVVNHTTYSTFKNCFYSFIHFSDNINFIIRLKAINDKGYINPLDTDIFDIVWKYLY